MPTEDDPGKVVPLHPPVHETAGDVGALPVRRLVGTYPGGPTVSRYGPSPFDAPEARRRAHGLLAQVWVSVECCIMGQDSDPAGGIVGVATHPDLAAEIVRVHNVALREGWVNGAT